MPTLVVFRINVNPGLIDPWLINRGVSPFSGDSDHCWREPPQKMGRVLLTSWVNIKPLEVKNVEQEDHFSGKQKVWTFFGPSTQPVSY